MGAIHTKGKTSVRLLFLNLVVSFALLSATFAGDPPLPSSPKRHLYFFPQPLGVETQLSTARRVGHVLFEAVTKSMKFYGALQLASFHSIGPIPATYVAYLWMLSDLPPSPPAIAIQSSIDLSFLSYLHTQKALKELQTDFEKVPDLRKVTILATKTFERRNIIAKKINTHGFLFMETAEPLAENLPKTLTDTFGEPRSIADPKKAQLKFSLTLKGKESPLEWTAALEEIFGEKPIDAEIANRWREDVLASAEHQGILKSLIKAISGNTADDLKINISLLEPTLAEFPLGILAQGAGVKKLLSMNLLEKGLKKLRGGERSIPLIRRVADPQGQLFAPKNSSEDPLRCYDLFKTLSPNL